MNYSCKQSVTQNSPAKGKSKQDVDLVQILEREIYPRLTAELVYNWTGHDFQRSGNRLRGKPPWGQSKSGNSFTAFDDLGFLDAHNGGETGNPVKYRHSLKVGQYEYPRGRDWLEIVQELASEAGVTLPSREWTPAQIEKARRRESRQAILRAVQEYCASILWTARGENERKHLIEQRGFTEQGLRDLGIGLYPSVKEVREVLRNKGLDLDLAKQVGVLARKWEGYMIFPWSNPYSEPLTLYGHQSKEWAAATGKPKKYALFNPKDNGKAWLHTKESPYLFNRVIRSRHKEVVLVEGITDAAIAHQQGDTRVIGCVAAMLSKDQCETMARHRIEKVTIALDPDAAGDAGIDSCIKSLLKVGISPYVAPKLPDGLDPDEFILKHGIDAWYTHLERAVHGYRWKAEKILELGDLATDAGKEAILKQAIAYIRSQSRDDKLALSLYFTPAIAPSLGMNIEDFREALERQFSDNAALSGGGDFVGDDGDDNPHSKKEFTQFTLWALYGDKPWICVKGKLYYWTGTHYKHSKDVVERSRIAAWCDNYAVPTGGKNGSTIITYPYAKSSSVDKVMNWVKDRLAIDPDLVNPSGLNCTNGVLQIDWEGGKPSWKLIPHDPALYYTYEPLVKYDPDADGSACSRMLEALDPRSRDIFLKTVGASLDLATVRKFKGRTVRGLIMKGHGANGKDTLREAVSLMYGRTGLTSCTLSDFASYDNGRKFPLARLRHSRVNWASENANTTRLDKIQSLKAFITGDPLSAEAKGRDEDEFTPTGIALFNANDTPKLQGTLEAITSRYAVLTFNKTFKIGANPELGEVEADPRFKYDPDFLTHEVLPAFLNRVLDALRRLMSEGIDYSCTRKALEDIQAENSHLFQFAQDTGLGYNQTCILTAGELWAMLEQWYLNNGTLTYEESSTGKQKPVWMEQANPYDRNVKGANQVLGRFQKLFPKAKRVVIPHPNSSKKNVPALKGLGFNSGGGGDGGQPTPIPPQPTPIPPQDPPQKTTENQGFHPTHPSFFNLGEKNEKTENPSTDPGNVNLKNSDDSQSLGWVGCDAQKSRVSGVDNWGGTGVENDQTGVGETAETDPDAIAKRVQSERIATPAVEIELEQWLTEESILGIAHDLEITDSKEVLGYLRDLYPKEALKEAVNLLSGEKRSTIKRWVIELNGGFAIGTKVRLNLPGSVRHGKQGIVIRSQGQTLVVKFDDYELRKDLREMECYPSWLTTDLESPLPDTALCAVIKYSQSKSPFLRGI